MADDAELHRLVDEWRSRSQSMALGDNLVSGVYDKCADELEAVITDG